MKSKKLYITEMAFVALILWSCSQEGQKLQSVDSEPRRKEVVKVMELQTRKVARTIEYPATLEAFEEVHLAPASPGRIENIHAEVGDRVNKGTKLVEMDRTQLRQAEVQLKNLETDFRRLDTLAKYGSIAQQQYDQLQTQFEVAKSNVEFLTDNVSLFAPFGGFISGRYYEAGEMYSGAPNTPAGKAAVLSLIQIDKLKAMVSVSEAYFPTVIKGMNADVRIDVYPNQSIKGQVYRIHPVVNPLNRAFNVEVVINNLNYLLRPGMFARIRFNMDEEEALLLPSMAVLKLQGSNERYLFVDDNGSARRVSVTTGKRYNDLIEVFSDDIKPGDRVIVTGQSRLLDGMQIEVVE